MPFQRVKWVTCLSLPNFASPIVAAGNKLISIFIESAVGEGQNVGLESFEKLKILLFFFLYLHDELYGINLSSYFRSRSSAGLFYSR